MRVANWQIICIFVKDKNGNLVDVSQVPTQIIRMK